MKPFVFGKWKNNYMKTKITVCLVLAMCLAGCSASEIISVLQGVTSAASAGISASAACPTCLKYIDAAASGADCAAAAIASGDSAALQGAKITGCFGTALTPALPPGTPTKAAAAVGVVAQSVATFLDKANPPSSTVARSFLQSGSVQAIKLSGGDAAKLRKIHSAALKAHQKLSPLVNRT
jgi:hypothetical protein